MSSTLEKAKCEQTCKLLKELGQDPWLVWVTDSYIKFGKSWTLLG